VAVHCRWRRPRDPFSGGNGLHGPQASGILAGRADRIRAADLNGNPNHSIGRAAKAAKEDIVGLIVALERYLQRNHAADLVQWRSQLEYVAEALRGGHSRGTFMAQHQSPAASRAPGGKYAKRVRGAVSQ